MNILSGLFKDGVKGLAEGIGGAAKDIRAAITGKEVLTAEERLTILQKTSEIELAAMDADKAIALAQAEINKIDAQSGSVFRGGWRPAIGWICAAGLLYEYLLWPFFNWGSANWKWITPPHLDMATMMPLLLGLLGIAGMRTFEKVKGLR